MKKNRNLILLAVLALPALVSAGCAKNEEKAQAPAAAHAPQSKPAPAPVVQKQLSSAQALPSQPDFSHRTDPFKPYAPVAAPAPAQSKEQQAPSRPAADLLPIQSFEVSRFKVAGIIAGLKENRALILDPNGKGYVVQQGMLLGNNEGRISRITASGVEVTESYKDEKGRSRKRTIVLTLAKKR